MVVEFQCTDLVEEIKSKGFGRALIPTTGMAFDCIRKQLSTRCMCVWSIYQSARVTVAHRSTLKPGPGAFHSV